MPTPEQPTATILKTDKTVDSPLIEEYKSPELCELMHTATAPGAIKPIWATKNLLIFFKREKKADDILFDLEKNKRCKSIFEQVNTTDTPLYQTAAHQMETESYKPEKCKVAQWTRILFKGFDSLRYATSKYQFINIDRTQVEFWNTSNPEQITLDKTINIPVSDEDSRWMALRPMMHTINENPWYFIPRLFPDKLHLMVKVKNKRYNFFDLKTSEAFSFAHDHALNIKIINNQQVLLTRDLGDTTFSRLMTVDLKNKRAKLNKEILFADESKNTSILPLSLQVILKIKENNDFTGHQVLSDGELQAIPALTGTINMHTQLETGEVVYWDKKKNAVSLIDPFAQRIVPLLKTPSVLYLDSNDHEVLIATPGQLHRVAVSDHQERAEQMLDTHIFTPVRNIVMDYVGFNRGDKPHLLTQLSFLTVAESENAAEELPKKASELKIS